MVEYQKQKKRDVEVILRWRKSPPPNQGLTYGETSSSAKGSSPFLVTITKDSEKSKLDWVASVPVRVGHEDYSSSGPAGRDEDLFGYNLVR